MPVLYVGIVRIVALSAQDADPQAFGPQSRDLRCTIFGLHVPTLLCWVSTACVCVVHQVRDLKRLGAPAVEASALRTMLAQVRGELPGRFVFRDCSHTSAPYLFSHFPPFLFSFFFFSFFFFERLSPAQWRSIQNKLENLRMKTLKT